MNFAQYQKAFQVAASDKDLTSVNDNHHLGFGIASFKPVATTTDAVAKTIRYQAHQFNGGWDHEALEEIRNEGRKKFLVLD